MNGRFFLDTNIFGYCFDRHVPYKQARANELVRKALENRTGVISYQVVQEFINLALRKFDPPMQIVDVQQYATVILRPLLAVPSSMALCQRALLLWDGQQRSWYDALIVAAALEARCAVLYSEDMQHGQRIEGLQVINPFV